MRFLFSIISLIGVVGLAVWWNMRDMSLIEHARDTSGETATPYEMTPIEKATAAKGLLESRNYPSTDSGE